MPPTAPNEAITQSVADVNEKNLGDAPAFYTQLAMGNAVAHQQAMQQLLLASTGSVVKQMTEVDPTQAVSVLKTLSGNDLGQTMTSLLAALASGQQGAKVAQTTPPPTA